ncbi:MAG: methylenetetrahydrofolate reductase C-terminal domain-containing protein, partial [Candidatus Ratteibacteria bacterium]|nr:methylenetetrahydrofolate reductase C-terminal domain-containing protein [Candidatus Ratteibacteria bacterium]
MLITRPKEKEKIAGVLSGGNVFIFSCFGCKEVYFPEEEVNTLLIEYRCLDRVARVDYLCREEFTGEYVKSYGKRLKDTKRVVVFSCGVGVQVVAKILPHIPVIPGCDTYYINGFQGLTTQDVDCQQCGQCWLNLTGGICPITSCSKGLLNGPCGGANK